MDRFIATDEEIEIHIFFYLKSNMDRFIEYAKIQRQFCFYDLKSNMDRFIAHMSAEEGGRKCI